jgi:hypothetical protein
MTTTGDIYTSVLLEVGREAAEAAAALVPAPPRCPRGVLVFSLCSHTRPHSTLGVLHE